jgi:hypothetical protein
VAEAGHQALEFVQIGRIRANCGLQLFEPVPENAGVFARIDGKSMWTVPGRERTFAWIEHERYVAVFQGGAVRQAQRRQQHLAAQIILHGMPFDIEKPRVRGRFAIFEHIQPPSVIAAHHPHVVRH